MTSTRYLAYICCNRAVAYCSGSENSSTIAWTWAEDTVVQSPFCAASLSNDATRACMALYLPSTKAGAMPTRVRPPPNRAAAPPTTTPPGAKAPANKAAPATAVFDVSSPTLGPLFAKNEAAAPASLATFAKASLDAGAPTSMVAAARAALRRRNGWARGTSDPARGSARTAASVLMVARCACYVVAISLQGLLELLAAAHFCCTPPYRRGAS